MSEFNNRIDAQREILSIINNSKWKEELNGLSRGAIERWLLINNVSHTSEIATIINEAAEKLFFLANKSQEQVSSEYLDKSKEIAKLTNKLRCLSL